MTAKAEIWPKVTGFAAFLRRAVEAKQLALPPRRAMSSWRNCNKCKPIRCEAPDSIESWYAGRTVEQPPLLPSPD
jgi:hypothetical protein